MCLRIPEHEPRKKPRGFYGHGGKLLAQRAYYTLADELRSMILVACNKCPWSEAFSRAELIACHTYDESPQALPISHNFQPNCLEQFFYVSADEMLDHKHSICNFFRIASKIFQVRLSQFFYLAFCRWAYCQT